MISRLLMRWADRLPLKLLFVITSILFIINVFTPDPIPFIDEILLGLLTLGLANWSKKKELRKKDTANNIIEGEVIHDSEKESKDI